MEKNNTWRETRISLAAATATPFTQDNTRPNWFMIVNNSATQIYVGTSPLIGAASFDIVIPAMGARTLARPDAPMEIWLYATGDSNLFIASMEAAFDPSMISQTQEIAAIAASGMLGTVDIRSLLNALPAGTNALGTVGITSLPALAAGTAAIGTVAVTSIPNITPAAGEVVKPAITPTIYNVEMTSADTEYSQALPAGCKKFKASVVTQDVAYRIAFETLKVATPTAPYFTKVAGAEFEEENILLTGKTLFFANASAGKIMQIIAWV